MDLGNCAILMDECYRTSEYNYGMFLWNGFVFNYIPKRIVGEEFKESIMFSGDASLRSKAKYVTHDITCTTGYFDAYSSFWYFGFILFWLLGYAFQYIKSKSTASLFYEMIFLFALVNSSVGMTHGLQLIVAKFEFVALLFLGLFFTLNYVKIKYKQI
ncbi:MAG: hypothetical protein LUD00_03545 [Prevotellaceae bacterium]|nr:hypothetical protein [Prevotellaceae bacterium]